MHELSFYQEVFTKYLNDYNEVKTPESLYAPIHYILKIGGKRLRPVLTLMSCEVFGGDYEKALDAALSVEVFHNFSLVHDDIMDQAPLRRGHPAVHEKWDLNTGILSGDAMLIMAYQLFENYKPEKFRSLAKLFSKTALEVCEGQQYDMDFEVRENVEIAEYLKMIEYKTAVLVGAAMQMGAIVANTTQENQHSIYEFGKNLGIAFQLKDDYLDAFGDPKSFGKQVGGDIIENKKTILFLKTLEAASEEDQRQLLQLYSITPANPEDKIANVISLFRHYQSDMQTVKEIEKYTANAFEVLEEIHLGERQKQALKTFGNNLMNRKF